MKVNDPDLIDNVVRADSLEARNGFSRLLPSNDEYDYFVPLLDNPNLFINTAHLIDAKRIEQSRVLVFNLKANKVGFVPGNMMVEPVDFTVNVEGIER